jgi:hypothetical protein
MKKKPGRLIEALTRTCVFIHTSRNWEDYDNMYLDKEVIVLMTRWIVKLLDIDANFVEKEIEEFSQSQYSALKTDWNIGCIQAVNVLALLKKEEKDVVNSYINNFISATLKDDAGVAKAIAIIANKM